MTPAEKRAMGKRYGVKEGSYRRPGQNFGMEETPDTYEKRLVKAAQNDYDTRKAQEVFHLAMTDKDYRKSLGSKAQKFFDNYKGSDKKDKDGMQGISNFKELQAINEFGKLYHKHERGLGGNYSSANDYGGGSMHMMDSMRKFHDRNFATKDDLDKLKNDEAATDEPTDDAEAPYTPSANLQRDLDLVAANENGLEFSSVFHDPEDSEDLRDKQAQQFKDQYQNSLGNNVFVANTDYIGGN